MKDSSFFKQQFEIVKNGHEPEFGFEDFEDLKGDIELEMVYIDNTRDPEFVKLMALKNEISKFIRENKEETINEYDPEAELDYMFPDRHDDDFDEDSMSYDSVFGGD